MKKVIGLILGLISIFALVGCNQGDSQGSKTEEKNKVEKQKVVNVYTDRHYDTDADLYDVFTKKIDRNYNFYFSNHFL